MLKSEALKQLAIRKKRNKNKKQINNSSLPAGSPMYFYCKEYGDESDCLPESYLSTPKKLCEPCKALKEAGLIVA